MKETKNYSAGDSTQTFNIKLLVIAIKFLEQCIDFSVGDTILDNIFSITNTNKILNILKFSQTYISN